MFAHMIGKSVVSTCSKGVSQRRPITVTVFAQDITFVGPSNLDQWWGIRNKIDTGLGFLASFYPFNSTLANYSLAIVRIKLCIWVAVFKMLISRLSIKVDLVDLQSFVSSRLFSKLYKKRKNLSILVELHFNKFFYRQGRVRQVMLSYWLT